MSKLSDSSEVYLNKLFNLNLYTPKNVYDLNNSTLNTVISDVVSIINNNSFEFSNSILGRVLLPNTPIQQIGNVELAKALASRVSKNLRTNVLPSVTINSNGITLTDANYWNISGNDNNSSFSVLLETILGYQTQNNPIPFISSTFTHEASNEYLKNNRGQGQIDSYFKNIQLNDFSPEENDKQYGSIEDITNEFSILYKTNQIILNNSLTNGYPALTGKEGDSISLDALAYNDYDTTGGTKVISRGGGTKVSDNSNQFLRVFNVDKQYRTTSDLMKFKHGTAGTNSVLQTVFPNISPLSTDTNVKNLMFSIENLAYADGGKHQLKPYEIGVNGGRAMWFPPYDLHISENTTSDYEAIKFIGRTEPIYTYNGSERDVNITFKLIVDYPSSFWDISWKTASNNEYDKFFRQNNDIKLNLSVGDENTLQVQQQKQLPAIPAPVGLNIYTSNYPFSNKLKIHFDDNGYTLNQTLTQDNANHDGQNDNNQFFNKINDLINFLNTDDGSKFKVFVAGFSSKLNTTIGNSKLSLLRAKSIYDLVSNSLKNIDNYKIDLSNLNKSSYVNDKFSIIGNGSNFAVNNNSTKDTLNQDVVDRYAIIYLDYNSALNDTIKKPIEDSISKKDRINNLQSQQKVASNKKIKGGEEIFFERLRDTNQLIYEKYSDELKYFSPVFHSQTPQDFNSRLTFLEQCCKQGNATSGITNSIFGRPPVCVLRLGDFFHTKIIITNMSKNYEPLIWDMNPEGIGMQPMICEVTLNCKVVGGQSLDGPLTKLQNALDYNFYANTEVYNSVSKIAISSQTVKSTQNTTQTVAVNSQTARIDDIAKTLQVQSSIGEPSSDGIKYNSQIDDIITTFNNWTQLLFVIIQDSSYLPYFSSNTGLININLYNNDKNADKNIGSLITDRSSKLNNFYRTYTNNYNNLTTIINTSMDNGKSLDTTSDSFTQLQNIVTNINIFYNTQITNIINTNSNTVSNNLTSLNKSNDSLEIIPFLT